MIVHLDGVDYDVDFEVTSYGSPAHMGSLSYPGDPGDPPEILIETVRYQSDPELEIWIEVPNAGNENLWQKLEEKIFEDPSNFEQDDSDLYDH